jgi:co-chaperonin GroES (HSP10)
MMESGCDGNGGFGIAKRKGTRVVNRENPKRALLVVGDRVLMRLETGDERTGSGLILPQTVADRQQVQSGVVVAVGPGVPMPLGEEHDDEPWREHERPARYIPMQAKVGDRALFLRKATVEIRYDGEPYLIVPQSAILVLLRDEDEALFHDEA